MKAIRIIIQGMIWIIPLSIVWGWEYLVQKSISPTKVSWLLWGGTLILGMFVADRSYNWGKSFSKWFNSHLK